MTTIDELLEQSGRTFADEAGITMKDEPAPLYRLLVLSVLLSGRVQAQLGTRACRELVDSGFGSPGTMRDAQRSAVHDALERARFLSKDQTTDALQQGAALVADRWDGDLRRMREEADGDLETLRGYLTEVPRLGPVGASIFVREVQAVWPEYRPHLDEKALAAAEALGLPRDAEKLAEQVAGDDLARLAAALVRTEVRAES
ncbi:endonuclease [Actinomycetospora lutea]|uniref:endonuclease n=1 Tax=Actinomycetospora lutea TaxID=663604 RepID=UPI0023660D31|nr:endonuclease [Actinomycetospora lutea]MDD7941007.1 endonuclease [Actinomycetospora lutea]